MINKYIEKYHIKDIKVVVDMVDSYKKLKSKIAKCKKDVLLRRNAFVGFVLVASFFVSTNGVYASSALVSSTISAQPTIKKNLENHVLDALKKYGEANEYGFKQSSIRLNHDILGFYNFLYQGKEAQLVVAYTNLVKDNDCHACAPKLSFFVFTSNNGQYDLSLSQINAIEYGQWGNPPLTEYIQVVKLAKDTYGFTIKGGGEGQGWNEENENFFLPIDGKFQSVLHVDTGLDNGGAMSDITTNWKSTITYRQGDGALYDVITHSSGTDKNKKFSKTRLYTFDGKKYNSASSSAQKIESKQAETAKNNTSNSLVDSAYKMMTGETSTNQSNILIKTNSKGIKIYCLSDKSMCKTEIEVKDYSVHH